MRPRSSNHLRSPSPAARPNGNSTAPWRCIRPRPRNSSPCATRWPTPRPKRRSSGRAGLLPGSGIKRGRAWSTPRHIDEESQMATNTKDDLRPSRRQVLSCMAWGSAGILWTVAGGVPVASALGAAPAAGSGGVQPFSFVQISDSHIGFDKKANPEPQATLRAALERVGAMGERPAFMLHTGDVSHLSKPSEFDAANGIMTAAGLDVHYVPGEHDTIDDDGKAFFERFGRGRTTPWYSFDQGGV